MGTGGAASGNTTLPDRCSCLAEALSLFAGAAYRVRRKTPCGRICTQGHQVVGSTPADIASPRHGRGDPDRIVGGYAPWMAGSTTQRVTQMTGRDFHQKPAI